MQVKHRLRDYTVNHAIQVPVPEYPQPSSKVIYLHSKTWIPNSSQSSSFPVILEFLPYRHGDWTLYRDTINYDWFASNGIACIRVSMRGSENSESYLHDEYLISEQRDAYNAIKWIKSQAWCNGHVFIWGKSWGGFNALQIAQYDYNQAKLSKLTSKQKINNTTSNMVNRNDRLLSGLIALHFTHDRYNIDVHYMGGCLMSENLQWASFMTVLQSMPPVLLSNDSKGANEWKNKWYPFWLDRLNNSIAVNGSWAHQWMEHSNLERKEDYNYWKHGSIKFDPEFLRGDDGDGNNRYENGINGIPAIIAGGYLDSYHTAVNKTLDLVDNKNRNIHGVMGAWEHQFPNFAQIGPRLPWLEIMANFMKKHSNLENDSRLELPYFMAYLLETIPTATVFKNRVNKVKGNWIKFDSREELTSVIENKNYGLCKDNDHESGSNGSVLVSNSLLVGRNHQRFFPIHFGEEIATDDQEWDNNHSTCLQSMVFKENVNIVGLPKVKLCLKLNNAKNVFDNTDGCNIVVRICVCNNNNGNGNGNSNGKDKESKLLVWKSFDLKTALRLNTDKYHTLTLELPSIYYKIPPNSRLVVCLSNHYWPLIWPNSKQIEFSVNVSNSELILPIIEENEIRKYVIDNKDGKSLFAQNMDKMKTDRNDILKNNYQELRGDNMQRKFEIDNNDRYLRVDYFNRNDGCQYIKDRKWVLDHCGCIEKFSIDIRNPLSAKHEICESTIVKKIGIFQTRIETKSVMTCDDRYFYLKSDLKVQYSDGDNKSVKYIVDKQFDRKFLHKNDQFLSSKL